MQAFFILGTNRELARTELTSVIGDVKPVVDTEDVLIVDDFDGNLGSVHTKLGGTIKTGVIYASVKTQDELIDAIAGLAPTLREMDGKFKFGISVYTGGHRGKLTALRAQTQRVGIKIKQKLKENGQSVRLVTSKIPVLSSVIVTKQKLLERGVEFCVFPMADEILIGVTESVQDFEEWGERDFERPKRDAKRGMLPPKLARMMVNMASGNPETDTLLDPFCGVGTVLTEAMELGYKHLIGSDIDEIAVDATRENVAWEKKRTDNSVEPQMITVRAQDLATFLAPHSVDRIVAELHLGKPRTGDEGREELEERLEELVAMYTESFRAFAGIVAKGATLVLAVPAYVVDGSVIPAGVVDRAKMFGFELIPYEDVETTSMGALRYGRRGQMVLRDIYRFKKV
ncbi:50S ribosomal protein L11 methyltransferase [Candidatus Uhrbacteria bacterium]|nr:50S ribosomal protein L11 methyltransferase [Candidatus Uhrbacteria bacterium]